MVYSVIQLGVVIRFVLSVDFFDLYSCKFNYSFVYHEVLDALMKVELLIDMGPGRVKWCQDNALCGNVFH